MCCVKILFAKDKNLVTRGKRDIMGNNAAKATPTQQEKVKDALVTACDAVQKAVLEVIMLDKVENESDVIKGTKEVVELITNVAEKTAAGVLKKCREERQKRELLARGGSGARATERARLEKLRSDLLFLELMRVALEASDSGIGSGGSGGAASMRTTITTIAHPWTRKDDLGKGAFGSVYSAVDKNGVKFAVKEVPKDGVEEESLRKEIKFLGNLSHKNLVRFYGCAGDKEKFYMYIELMQGSLRDVIDKAKKPISETMARRHTRDVLQGLIYLHGKDVIHRDIKCANVLLDTTGVAKLADMGISKKHDHSTMIGRSADDTAGTIPWMSPEVLSGQEGGKRSDIWSVGCTVYEMTRGEAPHMKGIPPILCAMILPRMILNLAHKGLVSEDDNFGPALKNFLMRIFVKMDERQFAEQVAEHPWVK